MNKCFAPIPVQQFKQFFTHFNGDTTDTLCQNCDGLCETSFGFSTTVFLLPGELQFLESLGVNTTGIIDTIVTPVGPVECWSPARLCTFLHNSRCNLGCLPGFKPVECAVYPLIFAKPDGDLFATCPVCRHASHFIQDGFLDRAASVLHQYLIPYLDPTWLKARCELNFTIDEAKYHQLQLKKGHLAITYEELLDCKHS